MFLICFFLNQIMGLVYSATFSRNVQRGILGGVRDYLGEASRGNIQDNKSKDPGKLYRKDPGKLYRNKSGK